VKETQCRIDQIESFIISITENRESTTQTAKQKMSEYKTGSVTFRKRGTTSTENTGKTESHNLIINLK